VNRIEEYRKQAGLTQLEAARAAGWNHQSRWSGYERGDRTPGLDEARVIVSVFNRHGVECSIDEVFPRSDQAA